MGALAASSKARFGLFPVKVEVSHPPTSRAVSTTPFILKPPPLISVTASGTPGITSHLPVQPSSLVDPGHSAAGFKFIPALLQQSAQPAPQVFLQPVPSVSFASLADHRQEPVFSSRPLYLDQLFHSLRLSAVSHLLPRICNLLNKPHSSDLQTILFWFCLLVPLPCLHSRGLAGGILPLMLQVTKDMSHL